MPLLVATVAPVSVIVRVQLVRMSVILVLAVVVSVVVTLLLFFRCFGGFDLGKGSIYESAELWTMNSGLIRFALRRGIVVGMFLGATQLGQSA